jgi:hypothetical protein
VPRDRELEGAAAGDRDVATPIALARGDELGDDALDRLLAAEALELQARGPRAVVDRRADERGVHARHADVRAVLGAQRVRVGGEPALRDAVRRAERQAEERHP